MQTPSLTTGDLGYNQDAWDRMTYFDFRPQLFFDSWASIRPTQQSMPGETVTMRITHDLEPATTPLDEDQDVGSVTPTDSAVSFTLHEYGNSIVDTRFLQATSYIPVNPVVAELLGFNAGISIDQVVSDVLHEGANYKLANDVSDRGDLDSSDSNHYLKAKDARRARARLQKLNVPTFNGYYAASIHPDVSLDLREETGAAAWRDPQVYGNDQMRIWQGEIGVFEGIRWIEAVRAGVVEGEALGGDDVYQTLFAGGQALGKIVPMPPGFGPQPRVVPGPVTDKLRRFVPMGWYHVVGYGIFREKSLFRVETAASAGTASE